MRYSIGLLRFIAGIAALAAAVGCTSDRNEPRETVAVQQQPIWTNGDFESDPIGTSPPTGWTTASNTNRGITDTRPGPQTLASLRLAAGGTLMTFVVGGAPESQQDPDLLTKGTLRFPKYGQRAVRVNYKSPSQNGNGTNVNTMKQRMTVALGDVDTTDNQVHVRFALAPILQNPSHAYTQQPYYFVRLLDVTTGTTLYQDFNASGQSGVPWKSFTDSGGNADQYTDWQLVDVAPGNALLSVGDQLELLIVASGCAAGGHWGRVYVDAVGSGIPGLYAWATGPQRANAGSDVTYTVDYKNGGTLTESGTQVDFVTPPSTTFQSVSLGGACTTPAVGATGTISCPLGTIAQGGTGKFTVTVHIAPATPNGTVITNGNYDIFATGVSALIGPKVQTTVTGGVLYADLGITKTDGVAATAWGQPDVYTVVASNAGPVAAPTVTVSDTMPAQLTAVTWTCVGAGGGSCAASGSGSINDGTVALPVGASVTYTVRTTIASGAGNGSVTNTTTVSVGGAVSDPDATNNTAVDTDSIGTLQTLSLTKTLNTAAGSVTSAPSSIACGTSCASASGQFLDGSQVILTAAPIAGATFGGWGGACSGTGTSCTLTMTGAQSVTAGFVGSPATLTVNGGSGQTTAPSTAFPAPLAVAVTDAGGNAVPGVHVTFIVPASGASATLSAGFAITDSAGAASVGATANSTSGAYAVTATVAGVASPATFNLANVGVPASVSVVSGSGQSASPTTAFAAPLMAVVRDAAGNPVAGVTVTFAMPSSGASASLSAPTGVTDAVGTVSVAATANTIAGAYAVTARVAGVATPASFNLLNTVGGANSIAIASGSGQSATVARAYGVPLVVFVADAYGNPVPGATVSFAAPSSGASAALGAPTAITDAGGNASVTATANTQSGGFAVVASVGGASTSASFALTNDPDAAAIVAVASGAGQSAPVSTLFAAALVVVVVDAYGNPVPGAAVAYGAPSAGPSAGLSSALVVTDASGQAAVAATANTVAGAYAVVVSVAGIGAPVFIGLTNTAGVATSLVASSGGGQSAVVDAAFAAPLVATVTDAYGNPVAGATVAFNAPSSGATATLTVASVLTNASGQASVGATASGTAGSYGVSASVGGAATVSFGMTNTAGAAATLVVVSGGGQSTLVATPFAAPLVVSVTDAHGNAVPGATVTFTAPGSGATASLSTPAVATDASGRASVTATASNVAGSFAVSASAPGVAAPVAFGLTNGPGVAATIAVVSGGGQTATAGAPFPAPLVVSVTDAHGNAVPGATVTFTAPGSGATAILSAPTAPTDASGQASVTATASNVAGSFTLNASAPGVAASATFGLTSTPGAAATLAVVSGGGQTTTAGTPFAAPLVVSVTDAHGNAVPGAPVTFNAPGSGATAILSAPTAPTDASGQASVTATASNVAGSFTLNASAPGVAASATFGLTSTPGAAATLAVVSGGGQTTTAGTPFPAPLVVSVTDAHGNAVPGATVTFNAPGSGATAILSAPTAPTDASGQASVTATASNVAGSFTLNASAPGVAAPVAFGLTNGPGVAETIAVVSGGGQTTTVGAPFGAPLVVSVTDAHGNAVPGATVTFTGPGSGATASLSAPTASSDASGQARVTATASNVAGSFAVAASAPGVATPVSFALTSTPGAGITLVVVSGGGQTATVGALFTAPLIVAISDAHGNPVAGATVTFTAPPSGATASVSAPTVATDASGRAAVTALASNVAGSFAVTANAAGVAAPVSFGLTNTPGLAAAIAILSGSGQTTTVGTPFAAPLVVSVTDAHGNAVPGAPVTFGATGSGATAILSSSTPSTDAAGHASVTAMASNLAGSFTVTASAPGVAAPVSFGLTNGPGVAAVIAAVSGSGQTATVAGAFTAPLLVSVTDAHGNPVPGATVTFSAPGSGATASLSAATASTDATGHASVTATASNLAGVFNVTASTGAAPAPAVFSLANLAGQAATIAAVGGSGQSQAINSAFPAPLVVVVLDAHGNPVAGAAVVFTSAGAGASAVLGQGGLAATDSGGHASVSATANAIAGTYALGATISGASAPAAFTLTNTPGAAAAIAIVVGDGQSTTVAQAFASPLRVQVRDSAGNVVVGASVSFTAPGAVATAALSARSVPTDARGEASVDAVASTVSGNYAVTAALGAKTASFALTNLADRPASLHVVSGSTPQAATVQTPFLAALALVVQDRFGNGVPQTTVSYSAPTNAGAATAVLSALQTLTDAQGRASLTARANAISGAYMVSAAALGLVSTADFTLSNLAGAPTTVTAFSGTPQSAIVHVDFGQPLVVLVADSLGNPVTNAIVAFAAPPAGPTATLAASSAATDSSGHASVLPTAGIVAGSYTVNASVSNGGASASFALTNAPGLPASVVAATESTPQSAQVGTAYVQSLVAVVVDAFGNAVPGVLVTYAAPSSSPTGVLGVSGATTDFGGRAAVSVTADRTAGAFVVNASVAGVSTPARFALTNLAAQASVLALVSGSPQTTAVTTAFASPLVVLVRDAYGNPVPNVAVTFGAPQAGALASLASPAAVSDANGNAQTTATAGTVAGVYAVTASVVGAATSIAFQLTNDPGAPASIVALVGGTPQSAEVHHPFAHSLGVAVADALGNPVPGVLVHFAAPAGGASAALSAPMTTTDATGQAQVSAIATDTAGSYAVSATIAGAGVTGAAAFSLTNTQSAPSSVTLAGGAGQHTMATAPFGAPVIFLVQDSFGNPVPGAQLVLTLPTSGASASAGAMPPVSDGQGRAGVQLTANGVPGTFSFAASVVGARVPVAVTMTVDPIPTTVVATPSAAHLTVDAPLTLTVTVGGAIGTPVGDVRIVDGSDLLGVATLKGGSVIAAVTLRGLGNRSLRVVFGAQGPFGASQSDPIAVRVDIDSGSLAGGGGCSVGALPKGYGSLPPCFVAAFGITAAMVQRRRRRATRARTLGNAAAIACGILAARRADAQSAGGFAIDRFRAAAAGSEWFALDSLSYGGHLEPSATLTGDYAHLPLVVYDASGAKRAEIVRDSPILHAGVSLAVRDRFRIALTLPFAPTQGGQDGTYNGMLIATPGAGVGDLVVSGDMRVAGDPGAPAAVALGVRATVPSGRTSTMLGDGVVGVEPHAMLAGAVGPFVYAAQAGVLLRSEVDLAGVHYGSELRLSASAGVRVLDERLLVGPELLTATSLENNDPHAKVAAEIEVGAHFAVTRAIRAGVGGGLGLARAIGTPDQRVLASMEWTPGRPGPRPVRHEDVGAAPPPPATALVAAQDTRVGSAAGAGGPPAGQGEAPSAASAPARTPRDENEGGGRSDPSTGGEWEHRPPLRQSTSQTVVRVDTTPSPTNVPIAFHKLEERVYFLFDRTDILPRYEPVLRTIVLTLAAHPDGHVRIEGHTDTVGSASYNEALSQSRAETVVLWLTGHGIDRRRLELVGLGFSQPARQDRSPAADAANRRVEVQVEDEK